MLIPREKPYLEGLNSYYLQLERFIEHMQGDIGTGSIYCRSARMEMMIYFNESEIISNLIQEKGQQAHLTPSLEIVRSTFYSSSCSVNVYQLDANAIYFWAQMPFFQRAKTSLKSSEIPLPDLIFRLRQKQFSGFIDVQLLKKEEGGILFFNEGDRIGGSFSWSTGGMSTSDEDYNTLLSRIQINDGLFSFGSFVRER